MAELRRSAHIDDMAGSGTNPRCRWVGIAFVILLASADMMAQQTKTYTLDCWSGMYPNNSCGICGSEVGDYNGNRYYSTGDPYPPGGEPWQPTCSYQDTLPSGAVVSGVNAKLYMMNCTYDPPNIATFNATLNGRDIASPITSTIVTCGCGDGCHAAIFDNVSPDGFVGYVTGGGNVFGIDVTAGFLILDRVDITVKYWPPEVAAVTSLEPFIPGASTVVNDCVLYRALITATLTNQGNPAAGKSVVLQSNRNAAGVGPDVINQPAQLTDSTGKTQGNVETRKTGTATITAQNYKTPQPATVSFGEATYENAFKITTYYTPLESEFSGGMTTNPCGLTGTFRTKFLAAVKLEGSGVATNGTVIQYYGGCYHTDTCPRTSSGVCAQAGVSVAVDPNIVPMMSNINITGLGARTAHDVGGAIDGAHIDDYVGIGSANYSNKTYMRAVRLLQGDPSCAN